MTDVEIFLVNLFANWFLWLLLAIFSAYSVDLRFGRNIVVVHTWIEAILSWTFWVALFNAVLIRFFLTVPSFKVRIVYFPESLPEWVMFVGSILIYFGFFVWIVGDMKWRARRENEV